MKIRLNTLACVGWAMYYENKTKKELDDMSQIQVIMLQDEFERWLNENIKCQQ